MKYKKLAKLIRQFANIELLAVEIESLEDAETIDELTDFLRDELDYSSQ